MMIKSKAMRNHTKECIPYGLIIVFKGEHYGIKLQNVRAYCEKITNRGMHCNLSPAIKNITLNLDSFTVKLRNKMHHKYKH